LLSYGRWLRNQFEAGTRIEFSDTRLATLRVLVVEDEADINALISARLVAKGYKVDEAFNGKEAIQRLTDSDYVLVFLDLAMPDINGGEVLDSPRRCSVGVTVIIVTAFGSQ
jgi:DNA-binding response OmpR family regulator